MNPSRDQRWRRVTASLFGVLSLALGLATTLSPTPAHAQTAIEWKYQQVGGANSVLGRATSGEVCGLVRGGCYVVYQGGVIVWSPASGAQVSRGAIRQAYSRAGFERGPLGYPISDEVCGIKYGGCYQLYQGGKVLWSEPTGAHALLGAIGEHFGRVSSEHSPLGMPTGDESCGLRDGGCYQLFEGGKILWSPASGAHALWGALGARFSAVGNEGSALGYPVSDEICGIKNNGCYQLFQGGAAYWSEATGAWEQWGLIRSHYQAVRSEHSGYGLPTSGISCAGGVCSQRFEDGYVSAANGPSIDYRNCSALRRDYPHGVGRVGAVDRGPSPTVRTFFVSDTLYQANTESDADRDGVACEMA